MGKKTRTRRTKWRRLSLGEASGPEEEDDEQQSDGVVVVLQQQSTDQELSMSGDEEQQQSTEQAVNKEMPTHEAVASASVSNGRPAPSSTSNQPSVWKQVNNSMSSNNANHHHQAHYEKAQGRSASPAACDHHASQLQAPHQLQAHHPQHHHQPPPHNKGQGYYGYHYPSNGLNSYSNGHANYQSANQQHQQQRPPFRRGGPHRYGTNHPHSNGGGGSHGYGRANSWTNGSYNNSTSSNGCEPPKSHGIEKKIFNDEEYTKISTPRQEVLFKKGSIGKKRPNVATPVAPTTPAVNGAADNDDSLNGNNTSPTLPTSPTGDGDSLHYNGYNDGASTGDASSTAGETQSPDAAAQNYDGAPMVCYPMYDMFGGYGAMYSGMGGMLVQTYPGGPLVAAVPVPVPVQPVDWYRAPNGEVSYFYALAYPNMAEHLPMEDNSPRSNSVESFQASSSQDVNSEASMANSENSSPCSTGPSSQGPASPQNELASPNGMDGIKSGACDSPDGHKMATIAGYIYPAGYGIAPAPVYAAGSGLGPSVESCESASSSCSAAVCSRDATAETSAPSTDAAQSGGAGGKRVQSQSQEMQNHCGSGAKGTGASASAGAGVGAQTSLGRRKKRKKKRKNRPEAPLIPWVTKVEKPLEQSSGDGNVSAQIPVATDATCANPAFPKTTTTTKMTPTTTTKTTTVKTSMSRSSSDSPSRTNSFSDPCQSDSSSDVADIDLDSNSNQSDVQSTESTSLASEASETATSEPLATAAVSIVIANFADIPAAPTNLPISATAAESASNLPDSSDLNGCPNDVAADNESNSGSTGQEMAGDAESTVDEVVTVNLDSIEKKPEPESAAEPAPETKPKPDQAIELDSTSSMPVAEIDSAQMVMSTAHLSPRPPSIDRSIDGLEEDKGGSDPPVLSDGSSHGRPSFDSIETDSLTGGSHLDGYEEDSLENGEDLLCLSPKESSPADAVDLSDECDQNKDPPKELNDVESLAGGRSRSVSGSAVSEGFETLTSDLIVDLLEQLQTWPEMTATDGHTCAALAIDFPSLEMEDGEDFNDEDDPGPSEPPPPTQLWKTVILEESEPNSKQLSRQSSPEYDEASMGASMLSDSSSLLSNATSKMGPITSAVSQWLESAPVDVQLISSTVVSPAESDEEIDTEDESAEQKVPYSAEVPKNEYLDPCTAPSNEDVSTTHDGPQRRVDALAHQDLGEDSSATNPQQQPDTEESLSASASSVCDPAKYSIYYHLGVSLEEDDDDDGGDGPENATCQTVSTTSQVDIATEAVLPVQSTPETSAKRLHSKADCPTSWRFGAESTPATMPPAQLSIDSGISFDADPSPEPSDTLLVHSKSISLEPIGQVSADSLQSRGRSRRLKSKSDPTDLSSPSSPANKRNSWRRTLRVVRAVQLLKKSPNKNKQLKSDDQSCCAIQ